MNILPILLMGITSVLVQVTALRRLMTVFSGNELDIGITLSVWFTAVALGSYFGTRIRSPRAFAWSFFMLGFLVQPSILAVDCIRPLFSIGFGEVIPFSRSVLSTLAILLPLCLIIGIQFPLAVSYSERNASLVYSIEGAGAFLGGILFTFFIAGKADAYLLAAGVSMVNLLIALLLLRKKYLFVILLIPLLLYPGTVTVEKRLQWKGADMVRKTESRYGEIAVLKMKDQVSLFSSGQVNFSYPDFQSEELRAHIPVSLHPLPDRILVIGGSPAVLRELLEYPVSSIDFVEIDPAIIEVSFNLLTQADRSRLEGGKVRVIAMDAREYIKRIDEQRYDLILLNIPEPSTANINRFYTVEFFRETKRILNEGGIIFLSLQKSSGYVGRSIQRLNGSVYSSLKSVFAHVGVSSEEYGMFFAGDSRLCADPRVLAERFTGRSVATHYFHPSLFSDVFDPFRVRMVSERLGTVDALNSDMMPVAYLYNLMVWAEIQGSGLLMTLLTYWKGLIVSLAAALILSAALLWRKRRAVYFTFLTTGYSSMAFLMIVVLAYQTSFGYVYERIGLLTAFFMAGIASGSYTLRDARRPLLLLRFLECMTITLLIASPLFFGKEPFFYLLSFSSGFLGGAEFSAANRFLKEQDPAGAAGRLYAFDLGGSFLGTLLTAIFFVPLLGIPKTILFVVCIKAASLLLLMSIGDEKN